MEVSESRSSVRLQPLTAGAAASRRFASAPFAWMNGELIAWQDAKLHIHTQCVMRGLNAFEGVRAYWSSENEQLYVFRLNEHMLRLADSTKVLRLQLPYELSVVEQGCFDLLRRCEFREDVH